MVIADGLLENLILAINSLMYCNRCLVVNPITVGKFAFLLNCTPVDRTSDSMAVPT